MATVARAAGAFVLLVGVFWSGRESTHGFGAFWEHWWCPVPLALIALGAVGIVALRRRPAVS